MSTKPSVNLAWVFVLILLQVSPSRAQVGGLLNVLGLRTMLNTECADFKILGPCSCSGLGFDQACLRVSYHVPKYLIETVLVPGDTLIGPGLLPPALGGALPPIPGLLALPSAGGAGNSLDSGHTALYFREVHVYSFPDLTVFGCRSCDLATAPAEPILFPKYLSELDAAAWRYEVSVAAVPLPLNIGSVGVWGTLYPRIGFNRHHELPVAAALDSYRALHVVHHPLPDTGSVIPRVVITPGIGAMPDCFQVGYPSLSRCAKPGLNPVHWDLEKIGPHGRNIFIYWERKECCVNPLNAFCGMAISAGNLDNFCDLPLIPGVGLVPGMPFDIPFDGK